MGGEYSRLASQRAIEETFIQDGLPYIGVNGRKRIVQKDDLSLGVGNASKRNTSLNTRHAMIH